MAELLVKIGDNAPWKDRIFDLKTTESGAMDSLREFFLSEWEGRLSVLTLDQRVAAVNAWLSDNAMGHWKHGDVIKARPDGFDWGSRESYPRNHIVYVPDAQLAAMGVSWNLPGSGEWKGPGDQRRILELERPLVRSGPLNFNRRRFGIDTAILGDRERIATRASNLIEKTQFIPFDKDTAFEHHSGGTFLIRASGGHYTDLSDWDANEAYDCVSGVESSNAECYDDWPGGLDDTFYLNTDWVSSASYMPRITVANGHRHDGTAETGFFVKYTGTTAYPFIVGTQYTLWDGVEWQTSGQTSTGSIFYMTGTPRPNVLIRDAVIHRTGGSGANVIVNADNTILENCVLYSLGGPSGASLRIQGATLVNAVAYSPGYGNSGWWGTLGANGDNLLVYLCDCTNVVAWNGNSAHDSYGTFLSCTGDYNCGDDASAPGANSLDNKTLSDLAWVSTTYGSEDFSHAQASVLVGAGIGPGADSDVPTEDIAYETRSGSTTDIGAFLWVASGGPTYEVEVVESMALGMTLAAAAQYSAEIVEKVATSGGAGGIAAMINQIFEGINLSDAPQASVAFKASITEDIGVGDAATAKVTYLGNVVEGLTLWETLDAISAYLAAAVESIGLDAVTAFGSTITCEVTEGLGLSAAAEGAAHLLAAIFERIKTGGSAAATAHFVAECRDGVAMAATIGSVVSYLAGITEGFTLTGTPTIAQDEVTGDVVITLSVKTSTVVFTVKKSGVSITTKKPGVNLSVH